MEIAQVNHFHRMHGHEHEERAFDARPSQVQEYAQTTDGRAIRLMVEPYQKEIQGIATTTAQVWKETLRVYDQFEPSFEARLAALDDNAYNGPLPTGA